MEVTGKRQSKRFVKLGIAVLGGAAAALACSGALATAAYADVEPFYVSDNGERQVTLQRGTAAVNLASVNGNSYCQVVDSAGKQVAFWSVDKDEEVVKYASITRAGTYTFRFTNNNSATAGVAIKEYGTDKTLSNSKFVYSSSCGDNASVSYYKIVAPSKGYVAFAAADVTDSKYGTKVTLYNSKKKAITSDWGYKSHKEPGLVFGVNKGTYYVGVKSYAPVYSVGYKFYKATAKPGSKKSKAVNIKKKKTVTGVVAAGTKTAQWYKFKQTKNKKVKITFTSETFSGGVSGGVQVTVYRKGMRTYKIKLYAPGQKVTVSSYGNNHKGTYYVKITPLKKGSGYYKIKWK